MIERPFAEIAAEDRRFVQMLDEFMETETEKKVDGEELKQLANKCEWEITMYIFSQLRMYSF
jgi:hypothetical protein